MVHLFIQSAAEICKTPHSFSQQILVYAIQNVCLLKSDWNYMSQV